MSKCRSGGLLEVAFNLKVTLYFLTLSLQWLSVRGVAQIEVLRYLSNAQILACDILAKIRLHSTLERNLFWFAIYGLGRRQNIFLVKTCISETVVLHLW